jgi:CheY-like chemotaxis protein
MTEGEGAMNKSILIVEDDEELQELYVTMLEGIDCQIVQAYDGEEAMQALQKSTPDLVILDIILDEMMGDVLYVRMKEDPKYAEMPVVIVSVLSVERCQHLLDMDPRTVFLRKPFQRKTLLEAVKKGLGV